MDLTSGKLILPNGFVVDRATTESNFLSSKDGASSNLLVKNNNYSSYKVTDAEIDGIDVIVMLYFESGSIYQIQIYFDLEKDPNIKDSDDVKAYLATWMIRNIGNPPYDYQWGNIEILTDIKSDFSTIALNYH